MGPGAGFTTTHGYTPLSKQPDYVEGCLHIYDAVNYAENAFNIPIVAYSGADDPQRAAARNIEEKLKELHIDNMTHLIAPGLKHQFPPEWQKKVEVEIEKQLEKPKPATIRPIRFVTYTLKYSRCYWLEIQGMEMEYEQARVAGSLLEKTLEVETANVSAVKISLSKQEANHVASLRLDQETFPLKPVEDGSFTGAFEKVSGKWVQRVKEAEAGSKKVHGLQGPIDDAFGSPFLCVAPTGKPLHPAMNRAAEAQLKRFAREWDHWMRGTLPIKKDSEVTEEDIACKNLILFGDPSSNTILKKALGKLPIQWTAESITLVDKTYAADSHLPMLIYPNPLNPKKYIVLNSGHTFHDPEFIGTNALLFPRLGDYAIVAPKSNEKEPAAFDVVTAGIFDGNWRIAKE